MELNKRAMKLWNKHNSVTDQNASQGGQTALKEHLAVLHSETASTTQQPRGQHRGTIAQLRIARLQAPLRGKDKVIIHSPHSTMPTTYLIITWTKKISECCVTHKTLLLIGYSLCVVIDNKGVMMSSVQCIISLLKKWCFFSMECLLCTWKKCIFCKALLLVLQISHCMFCGGVYSSYPFSKDIQRI